MSDIRSFLTGTPKESNQTKNNTNNKVKPSKQQKSSPNKKTNDIVKATLPKPLPKPKSAFEYIDKSKPQHKDTPPHLGEIEIPAGSPSCLEGLYFTASGTLNSITREQLKEILTKYGAKYTNKVLPKTDIFIRGVKDVSREKLEQARDENKIIIDEEGLFYIIRKSITPSPEEIQEKEKEEDQKSSDKSIENQPKPIISSKPVTTQLKPKAKIMPLSIPDSCPNVFSSQESDSQPRPESQPTSATTVINPGRESVSTLFTEKYRPKLFSELVGNKDGVQKLRQFLKNFDKQEKKAVIIYGPPGIGKTTSAVISAKSEGYHVIEFNASDTRNKQSVEKVARDIFSNQTLFKYRGTAASSNLRSCIIFDEVDGMSTGDRGGVQALTEFVKNSRIPIICICNDGSSKKLIALKKLAIEIPFKPPNPQEVAQRLDTICKAENIKMNRMKYIAITSKAAGDLRSALNTLQLWSSGVEDSSQKDSHETDPFQAILTIFKANPKTEFEKKMDCFFVDYDSFPAYVHHYCTMNDRKRDKNRLHTWFEAIDSMALGNEMEHVIRSENAWDLLNPLAVVSSVIPATLCPKYEKTYPSFPEDFSRASTQNSLTQNLKDIAMRCRRSCGTSTAYSFRDSAADLIVRKFNYLIQNKQDDEALEMLDQLELTKDDLINLQRIAIDFKDFSNTSVQFSEKANKTFIQLYKQKHPEIKNNYKSNEEERADFYITSLSKTKKKSKK